MRAKHLRGRAIRTSRRWRARFGQANWADLLRPTGLLGMTGFVREEAVAEFREPVSVDDEQLTLLGVEGVRVTPLELAAAYRWLALELAAHPSCEASQVMRAGLEDSASFGMAGQASLGGVPVMGKTGTADSKASGRSHGWFLWAWLLHRGRAW